MDKIAMNIQNFCAAVAPYTYALAIIAVLVIGIMFAIPSEKAHEKAKSYGGWVIIGTLLVAGAVTLGTWITRNWSF